MHLREFKLFSCGRETACTTSLRRDQLSALEYLLNFLKTRISPHLTRYESRVYMLNTQIAFEFTRVELIRSQSHDVSQNELQWPNIAFSHSASNSTINRILSRHVISQLNHNENMPGVEFAESESDAGRSETHTMKFRPKYSELRISHSTWSCNQSANLNQSERLICYFDILKNCSYEVLRSYPTGRFLCEQPIRLDSNFSWPILT